MEDVIRTFNEEQLSEMQGSGEVSKYAESANLLLEHFFQNQKSKHTEKNYRRNLTLFFKYTQEKFSLPRIVGTQAAFDEINHHHVLAYRKYLNENRETGRPYAPKSIIAKLAVIRSFYKFLAEEVEEFAHIKYNPAANISRPTANNVKETKKCEKQNVKDVLGSIHNPMHIALIGTLFTTGMRQGELRNIKFSDLEQEKGYHIVYITLKGGKKHKVTIHPTTYYHIEKYLEYMAANGRNVDGDDWLFQSTKKEYAGKQLSPNAPIKIIKKYFGHEIIPHSARATYISRLIEKEVDLYKIANSVGHANPGTTKIYDKNDQDVTKSPALETDFY